MKALIITTILILFICFDKMSYADVSASSSEVAGSNLSGEEIFSEAIKYHHGIDGVDQDLKKAISLYMQAAKLGNGKALLVLGMFYDKGKVVTKNQEEAFKYYMQAASKGISEAEFNIGSMYYSGEGVEQSYSKALEWFERSASKGNPKAAFNLGGMYYNGDGIKQDESKAKYWLQVSSSNGNPAAALILDFFGHDIEPIGRDLNNL